MGASAGVGEWLPVKDASERLGLTVDQARRRLRSGQLRGRQVAVAQGHVWEVWLPDDTPAHGGAGAPGPDTHDQAGDGPHEPTVNGSLNGAARQTPDVVHAASDARRAASGVTHQMPDGTPEGPGAELVTSQRAREMAECSAALLEPWRRRVEELSRENGRLEERATHLEAERDATRVDLEHAQAERDGARAELEAAGHRAEEASREADAARQEAEETVRLAEEAAGLRDAPPVAGRPWWRFWG
jgi:hypothetical protein